MTGQFTFISYRNVALHMQMNPSDYPGGTSEWLRELQRLRDEFHQR